MDKDLFLFYRAALGGEIAAPLCAEYKKAWNLCGDDKEMLMRLAMRKQSIPYVVTHTFQKKGLNKEYIKSSFGEFINGVTLKDCDNVDGYTYQLWVDPTVETIYTGCDVVSMMFCDNTGISIERTKCPTLYVSNYSSVNITLNGYSNIMVYLFDESKVVIDEADETCDVVVYKYSNRAEVELGKYCLGKVNIFNKQLKI